MAQTVKIGEQKVCPESESLKFSTTPTPTPQVENPSDSDSTALIAAIGDVVRYDIKEISAAPFVAAEVDESTSSFCYRISRTPVEEAENSLTTIISKMNSISMEFASRS